MPYGTSDGEFFADEPEYLASTTSTMPPGGSTEPAGEFKSSGGVRVPVWKDEPEKGILDKVDDFMVGTGIVSRETVDSLPDVLKGVWESAKNAFMLPGEVAQGNIDPGSPQAIERAFDLAGLMIFGPAPVAKKMADGTLGSFAGVKSKTLDKNQLAMAQIMESRGMSNADEIFEKTGMFRGTDGRWRYEISDYYGQIDEGAFKQYPAERIPAAPRGMYEQVPWTNADKYAGQTVANLSEFYRNPSLYKAYPQLKDMKVIKDPDFDGIAVAYEDHFIYNPKNVEKSPWPLKEIVTHEVQHLIQNIEGFSKGGAAWKVENKGKDPYLLNLQLSQYTLDEIKSTVDEVVKQAAKGAKLSRNEMDELLRLSKILSTHEKYLDAANKQALEYYARLAGEVESRNVQFRSNMPVSESSMVHPRLTEDIIPSQQIHTQEPVATTAYGLWDSAGNITKPSSIQDIPGGFKPYSPRWPNNDNTKPLNEAQQFIKDWDALHAAGKNIKSEVDMHRYNKMGRELHKKFGFDPWEDAKWNR